jgi:very-short-patch-repair endonuclease
MRFESPIEERLWAVLEPVISPDVRAETQVSVTTQWGVFRLDFMLQASTERVAIECDGAEFHDRRRDEWRDSAVLGTRGASTVYRLPGWAITHRPEDCLYFLARHDGWLFSDRGRNKVERSVSRDFAELCETRESAGEQIIAYREMPAFADWLSRRTVNRKGQFWRELYRVLLRYPGRSLDEAMAAYDAEPWP